jgi:large subunit ribosomal protein L24e
MKRNPRKLAWTKAFRRAHGKEMTVDSTLAFAQRRNIPVRYNRDLVAKTLQAMQRVSEIRARRERQFYVNRMKGNKAKQLAEDRKLVAENQHLLPPAYRDQVQDVLTEELDAEKEEMDLVEEDELELKKQERLVSSAKSKLKAKGKQRLVRGQGPEEMDVDE